MAYNTLIGAQFFISTGLDAAKNVTAITNAAPPVFTSAAHGYNNGDELLNLNNWDDFNESILRTSAVATNTFAVAGYDTSDANFYPPASAPGTVQKISGWLSMGQVLGINASGGEASFEEIKPFDRRNGLRQFTGFSGASIEFTLGWDRSRTDQQALQTSSRVGGKRALKFILPGGVFAYAYGTVSASSLPGFESILKQKVVFTINGQVTSF